MDYKEYDKWKGWGGEIKPSSIEQQTYDGEFRGIDVSGNLLELGFGGGAFLAWSRARGAGVVGCDLNERVVETAKAAGFEVHLGSLPDLPHLHRKSHYRIIVAFDVFEHMTIELLNQHLAICADLLEDGGFLLARIPNGQSPFGRIYQYGDVTHMSVLSIPIIAQLAQPFGFRVWRSGNSYRINKEKILVKIRNILKAAIEVTFAAVYYGKRLPLDPNVTIVLKKL